MPTRKLIEVALPLEAINTASAREKSIRHGHPSTMHLWWARRPLAACRAVLFASLVDDPSSHPNRFPTEESQQRERERLFGIIERLVKWENSNNEHVLREARDEILKHTTGNPPPVYDPFAGGGSIPLEAQRLGLEAHASDLNPVAVLINKALIEIPPKFANMPPVNPGDNPGFPGTQAARPHPSPGTQAARPHPSPGTQAARPHPSPGTQAARPHPSPGTQAARSHPSPGARAARPHPVHKGWHSRGYLPHFDVPGLVQMVTYRLADSMPTERRSEWQDLLSLTNDVARRKRVEAYLDAGHGSCNLRDERIAQLVEANLLHFDGQRYRLLAWVIMPNHVHVLIETFPGYPLEKVVHTWKSYTAKEANKILGRSGDFWQPEYFDRYIRDEGHFNDAVRYIHENPVKAGLIVQPEQWVYSSAAPLAGEPPALPGNAPLAGAPPVSAGAPPMLPGNAPLAGEPPVSAGAPPMLPGNAPLAGEPPALPGGALPGFEKQWKGAAGLAADVRYYGKWMRDEAEKRIGHLYPKVQLPKEYGGGEATVIAWLWARTVTCPNPACGAQMPLVRSFELSKKKGKEHWVEPVIEPAGSAGGSPARDGGRAARAPGAPGAPGVRFTVQSGSGKPPEGTVGRRGARCLCCQTPVPLEYVRDEGKAGRMAAQMLAIVAEGKRGRIYLPPTTEHEQVAASAQPAWAPETELPEQALGFRVQNYGLTKHRDLFTSRQLTALTTFSDLVGEARERVRADAGSAGGSPAPDPAAYADAVATYLALGVSKIADSGNSLVSWKPSMDQPIHLFTRQAIPIVWDFAEPCIFSGSMGDLVVTLTNIARSIEQLSVVSHGRVSQIDAQKLDRNTNRIFSTDPPYYDNVPYADLSDFFYVWLRHSLKEVYPDLFGTLLVPKAQELVAEPFRHGGREAAQRFFEEGLLKVFERIRTSQHPAYPLSVYYAFKQAESDADESPAGSADGPSALESGRAARAPGIGPSALESGRAARAPGIGPSALESGRAARAPDIGPSELESGRAARAPGIGIASTGWETMLQGLIQEGFTIVGTWPIRTELGNRMRNIGSNALASSIVLVCRPRPAEARAATRREFLNALKAELPAALRRLQQGNIAPVDLAQAAIGPGMAVFSRYSKVVESDGSAMRVRTALQIINQELDTVLAEQEGEFDGDTRWAIAWFDQYGVNEGPYGVAETLSKAKNTSVEGMVEAGLVVARSGKVRLLSRDELPGSADGPSAIGSGRAARTGSMSVWEVAQHLVHALDKRGEAGAAALLAQLGGEGEIARDLAYRLYTTCERKGWAQEALAYNSLVVAWPEIRRLAAEAQRGAPVQGRMEI
ncbi:REP-associated tyrosine transposase [Candidatus Viridilinea mediisalina]|uniref:Transposase IS200-like domain-containing protein n=1 Tax=Candidatus Viridilinea mediisalina TaxID=2024553 RepID=A0A2A6RQ73_9CHLR|nr:DUF1156 domain-containing protein [Candidatus Viridilinea mediisalina]PDW05106.1 hypothetical protein CJ255_00495 [Candidatus Viridilinea mediisalina]